MRIAVCVSGHLRTFSLTFPHIRDSLSGFDVDYFFHLWDDVGNSQGWHSIIEHGDDVTKDVVSSIVIPKKIVIQNQSEVTHVFPKQYKSINPWEGPLTPQRLWPQFYKIQMCDRLRQDTEKEENFKYDYVIRLRADLRVLNLDLEAMKLSDDETIVVGLHELDDNEFDYLWQIGGVSDKFAIGNSVSMTLYSSLYDHVNDYCADGVEVIPEKLYGYHLYKMGLDIKCAKHVKTVVIRKDGQPNHGKELNREQLVIHIPQHSR
jgi:hypothetical protein